MKYLYAILLSTIISVPAHAEVLNLFIQNSTGSSIVAEKGNSLKIPVPPHNTIENVPFERNTQVKNYVNGKLECTWTVSEEGMPKDWRLVGLYYDVYGSQSFCGMIAKDSNNNVERI